MRNIQTLLYFMRYFEPHCYSLDGKTTCCVSALEYPDQSDALAALGGDGMNPFSPRSIALKYARFDDSDGNGRWHLHDVETSGAFPVWVAW